MFRKNGNRATTQSVFGRLRNYYLKGQNQRFLKKISSLWFPFRDDPPLEFFLNVDFSPWGKQYIISPKWTFFGVLAHCALCCDTFLVKNYYVSSSSCFYMPTGPDKLGQAGKKGQNTTDFIMRNGAGRSIDYITQLLYSSNTPLKYPSTMYYYLVNIMMPFLSQKVSTCHQTTWIFGVSRIFLAFRDFRGIN